ncbi:MAG: hypothetical protein JW937_00270 [Candidatus Omnitrophica bacterium]|nr:hypothetical protein [Candidatus Omnitrophota bacterium]
MFQRFIHSAWGRRAATLAFGLIASAGLCLVPSDAKTSDTESPVSVPQEYGRVAQSTPVEGAVSTVFLVQDLHAHPEAQQHIAQLLQYWHQETGLPLVLSEGSCGPVDTSRVASFPLKAIRERFARVLLDQGELTGEEYLAIVEAPGGMEFRGVEDPDLYWQSQLAWWVHLKAQEAGAKSLEDMDKVVGGLKEKILPPEFIELSQFHDQFARGELQLLEWTDYLWKAADILKGDLGAEYPQLAALRQTSGLEKEMPLEARQDPRAFVQSLIGEAQKTKTAESVERVQEYAEYIRALGTLNAQRVIVEINELFARVRSALAADAEAQAVLELSDYCSSVRKLFELALTTEDWIQYQEMDAASVMEVLGILAKAQGRRFEQRAERAVKSLEKHLVEYGPALEAFYRTAEARDQHMFEEARKRIGETKTPVAVLVAGGFHTQGLAARFEKAGISTVVITPAVRTEINESRYYRLMQGQRASVQDLLARAHQLSPTAHSHRLAAPFGQLQPLLVDRAVALLQDPASAGEMLDWLSPGLLAQIEEELRGLASAAGFEAGVEPRLMQFFSDLVVAEWESFENRDGEWKALYGSERPESVEALWALMGDAGGRVLPWMPLQRRPLTLDEIEILQGRQNSAADWSQVWVAPEFDLGSGAAQLTNNYFDGPVYLGAGARISGSVIGNSVIGDNAKVHFAELEYVLAGRDLNVEKSLIRGAAGLFTKDETANFVSIGDQVTISDQSQVYSFGFRKGQSLYPDLPGAMQPGTATIIETGVTLLNTYVNNSHIMADTAAVDAYVELATLLEKTQMYPGSRAVLGIYGGIIADDQLGFGSGADILGAPTQYALSPRLSFFAGVALPYTEVEMGDGKQRVDHPTPVWISPGHITANWTGAEGESYGDVFYEPYIWVGSRSNIYTLKGRPRNWDDIRSRSDLTVLRFGSRHFGEMVGSEAPEFSKTYGMSKTQWDIAGGVLDEDWILGMIAEDQERLQLRGENWDERHARRFWQAFNDGFWRTAELIEKEMRYAQFQARGEVSLERIAQNQGMQKLFEGLQAYAEVLGLEIEADAVRLLDFVQKGGHRALKAEYPSFKYFWQDGEFVNNALQRRLEEPIAPWRVQSLQETVSDLEETAETQELQLLFNSLRTNGAQESIGKALSERSVLREAGRDPGAFKLDHRELSESSIQEHINKMARQGIEFRLLSSGEIEKLRDLAGYIVEPGTQIWVDHLFQLPAQGLESGEIRLSGDILLAGSTVLLPNTRIHSSIVVNSTVQGEIIQSRIVDHKSGNQKLSARFCSMQNTLGGGRVAFSHVEGADTSLDRRVEIEEDAVVEMALLLTRGRKNPQPLIPVTGEILPANLPISDSWRQAILSAVQQTGEEVLESELPDSPEIYLNGTGSLERSGTRVLRTTVKAGAQVRGVLSQEGIVDTVLGPQSVAKRVRALKDSTLHGEARFGASMKRSFVAAYSVFGGRVMNDSLQAQRSANGHTISDLEAGIITLTHSVLFFPAGHYPPRSFLNNPDQVKEVIEGDGGIYVVASLGGFSLANVGGGAKQQPGGFPTLLDFIAFLQIGIGHLPVNGAIVGPGAFIGKDTFEDYEVILPFSRNSDRASGLGYVLNQLHGEHRQRLVRGFHELLAQGLPAEIYFEGWLNLLEKELQRRSAMLGNPAENTQRNTLRIILSALREIEEWRRIRPFESQQIGEGARRWQSPWRLVQFEDLRGRVVYEWVSDRFSFDPEKKQVGFGEPRAWPEVDPAVALDLAVTLSVGDGITKQSPQNDLEAYLVDLIRSVAADLPSGAVRVELQHVEGAVPGLRMESPGAGGQGQIFLNIDLRSPVPLVDQVEFALLGEVPAGPAVADSETFRRETGRDPSRLAEARGLLEESL